MSDILHMTEPLKDRRLLAAQAYDWRNADDFLPRRRRRKGGAR